METCTLLGVNFHVLTTPQLISVIVQAGKANQQSIIANVNVHAMNLAYEQPWFKNFLNSADIVFCDGFGVALAARLVGQAIGRQHRMTCPDWIESLGVECSHHNLSLFLLGGQSGVVDAAAAKLQQVAPGLRVATHHGFFEKSGSENDQVIDIINKFRPDILYVGFGMPHQEAWIQENKPHVSAKVLLPLGACLDFYTGSVYRGPQWLTDYGFEWLSRLFTEPRRLWKRYLIGNPRFFLRVFIYSLKHRN